MMLGRKDTGRLPCGTRMCLDVKLVEAKKEMVVENHLFLRKNRYEKRFGLFLRCLFVLYCEARNAYFILERATAAGS